MKILIYGVNFSPELTGIGKYSGEMAEYFSRNGWDVRVVSAPPYYPDWQIDGRYKNTWKTEKFSSGIIIYRAPLWVPRKPGGLKRLIHLATFAASSIPSLLCNLRWKPDFIFVVEPSLLCAPNALLLGRLTKAKTWLHVQDYEIDAAFRLGLLGGGRLEQVLGAAERWIMRRFDLVSSISGKMVELAERKGVEKNKLFLFPNWVDVKHITPTNAQTIFRSELNIPADAFVALYSGNMGGKQGLEILGSVVKIFESIEDCSSKVFFIFCGSGPAKVELKRLVEGSKQVRFLDLQPLARLSDLLATADVHLLPQRADAADLVMPSKLTGMLASGRPVVATAAPGTELEDIIFNRARCGLVVTPDNAEAFAQGILQLYRDADKRLVYGVNARNFAERELDRTAILNSVSLLLRKLRANPD
ncbi:glycosyltransferase WbuB [Pseudacidovorax intermedius]|uniref:glycosyltransferase WbuB n=1 Tax=Pseudacidovorax intermedius TaxID=433924 RepID=UPI0009DBC432|nr:glycosyltransferase WbuB [Pseudacidovorax intermedius]